MYYIKSKYPELIERYNIPLGEYPRRCEMCIRDRRCTMPPGT